MIRPLRLRRIRPARTLMIAASCSALVLIAVLAFSLEHTGHATHRKRQPSTFEDRVAAQRALEEVYHRHRLWPNENHINNSEGDLNNG